MSKNDVIGYVRVSVDNENKVSPEMQVDAIEAWCKAHGKRIVEMIVERGRSAGEGKKRPGLDRGRKMIRQGQAVGIVVWKIDRCSRSVKDFAILLSELRDRGADFISVTESFDTSTSMGRMMVRITMDFAELERDRAVERSTAWHQHRVKHGALPPGVPRYGYRRDVDDDGKYVGPLLIDDEAAKVVRHAVHVFLETQSVMAARRVIAEAGRRMQVTEVRRLLMSPTIAGFRLVEGVDRSGKDQQHSTRVAGDWPAIIDEATHQEVVRILTGTGRHKLGRPSGDKWLLTGWMTCGRCGRPMRGGGEGRYRCTGMSERAGEKCGTGIKRDEIEAHVVEQLLVQITPQKWKAMRTRRKSSGTPYIVDTVAMDAELEQMAKDWGAGLLTRAEFYAAKETLLARIAEATTAVEDDDDALPDVVDIHKAWPTLTIEQQRLVIPLAVDKVVIEPGVRGGGSLRHATAEERMDARSNVHWRVGS